MLITACDNIDVSKLSDKDLERISDKLIVCNAPYIRFSSSCCLDQNTNNICDVDEGLISKDDPKGYSEGTSQETKIEGKEHQLLVCHKENGQSMDVYIDESALQSHLDHGDTKGNCVLPTPALQPTKSECSLQPGLICLDYTIEERVITIVVKNVLGDDATIASVGISGCGTSSPSSMLYNGGQATYQTACVSPLFPKTFSGILNVTYISASSGFIRSNIGIITIN